MFHANWTTIPVIQYLFEAGRKTRTFWLGNYWYDGIGNEVRRFPIQILEGIFSITSTQTFQCIIHSCSEWNNFISDSLYVLDLTPSGKSWNDTDAKKTSFKEWFVGKNIRNDSNYQKLDEKEFKKDNVIVTVFDTKKEKRLIVDGWHRAAALTMACEDGINIPEVRIMECAGNQVNVIFPCDIHQLP